jgi:aminoglycoside 6'-N-acetyltransferase I
LRVSVEVRPARPEDAAEWAALRQGLWPDESGEHAREIARFFAGERLHLAEALLAIEGAGRVVGFAELAIRPYAEGCRPGRVAYLEGWFVEPGSRDRGVGAALVRAAEAWGRAQGCREMASDTEVANEGSIAAHRALGFTEVERIVCFRKDLR